MLTYHDKEVFDMTTQELLQKAKASKAAMALADTDRKNRALLAMADALIARADPILAANALDMEAARGTISEVMLDRLALNENRIAGMAQGVREVADLPDPVGVVLNRVDRPNGLVIQRVSVPMGVIAIIYESRPNVTSDAAALALKAGSACVLRCGKEAHHSAAAIVAALIDADLLILLSDIDGLYTDDPRKNPDAEFVEIVEELSDAYMDMGKGSTGSSVGTGGMNTKLTAAKIATKAGADMLIANSKDIRIIHRLMDGRNYGTLFVANKDEDFDLPGFVSRLKK